MGPRAKKAKKEKGRNKGEKATVEKYGFEEVPLEKIPGAKTSDGQSGKACKSRIHLFQNHDFCSNDSSFKIFAQSVCDGYPPITYYWTGLLILDHSYPIGDLTNSKIAETKALQPPKS